MISMSLEFNRKWTGNRQRYNQLTSHKSPWYWLGKHSVQIERPKAGAEYFVRVSYTQKTKTLWADKGYEVASAQFKLPINTPPVVEPKVTQSIKLKQDAQSVTIAGNGFTVGFDKKTGFMNQLIKNGTNLLTAGGSPKLHLWRAAHRNDDNWAYSQWEKFGVNTLQYTLVNFKIEKIDNSSTKIISTTKAEWKSRL